jgi:hypothetical protein
MDLEGLGTSLVAFLNSLAQRPSLGLSITSTIRRRKGFCAGDRLLENNGGIVGGLLDRIAVSRCVEWGKPELVMGTTASMESHHRPYFDYCRAIAIRIASSLETR